MVARTPNPGKLSPTLQIAALPPSDSMHLIFLIHGLAGSPKHLDAMATALNDAFVDNEDVEVYVGKANSALQTFDGVKDGAHRYYEELIHTIDSSKTPVTHLSVIGYSLGGLIGRYVVGMLEDDHLLGPGGIEPVLFATFASPHLGNRFAGKGSLAKVLNFCGSHLFGRTGRDLFGHTAVLADMADPDQCFYGGLKRFSRLLLFANTVSDRTVPFWTSYITTKNPFSNSEFCSCIVRDPINGIVDLEKTSEASMDEVEPKPSAWQEADDKFERVVLISLSPFFIVIILGLLSFATVWSWGRKLIYGPAGRARPSKLSTMAMDAAETVMEDTLDDFGAPGERRKSIVTAWSELDVDSHVKSQAENLNQLPWSKYAVWFNRMHTHAEIIDRRQRRREGGKLVEYFSAEMKETHTKYVQGTSAQLI